jgi:hypothetical protein
MTEISGVGVAVADGEPPVIFFLFLETNDLVLRVCLSFIKSFNVGALWTIKGLTETGEYSIGCPLALLAKSVTSTL